MNRVLLKYKNGQIFVLSDVQMIYMEEFVLKIVYVDRVEDCNMFDLESFKIY